MRATVDSWRKLDIESTGAAALAYLPPGSTLRGTIYPVIKHTDNSFVFETDTDPAIFLYVNPEVSQAKFADTLTHELHHIGGSHSCPEPAGYEKLPPDTQHAVDWLSGFGEGLAMLAAAGGPEVNPHATSSAEERAVWERDVANFKADIEHLEAFFFAIVRGELSDDERRQQGFTFINTAEIPQGAFYTVGWKMAAMVEVAKGRDPVIASVCDPRVLLTSYNDVVASSSGSENKGVWSQDLIGSLYGHNPTD